MSTLLLRFAAPLQAWGTDSKFEVRRTDRNPSKSGVIGLLGAALGIPRDGDFSALRRLKMGVRVDREGVLLRDYHTAHAPEGKASYITHRYYLSDAIFLV
ncbi:MAG: type I-E CRISPR-associated protein Cas5/CasD, partial [Lachnospiraceae bacterium]